MMRDKVIGVIVGAIALPLLWRWTYEGVDPWASDSGFNNVLIGLQELVTFGGGFPVGAWLFPAIGGAFIGWAVVSIVKYQQDVRDRQAEAAP